MEAKINTIMEMGNACIIVGGPEEQVYGTLDFIKMFIWTSREKAEEFIKKNLDPNEDKIIEKPMTELLTLAQNLGFKVVLFDFEDNGANLDQSFINYRLGKNGILDLLSNFFSSTLQNFYYARSNFSNRIGC